MPAGFPHPPNPTHYKQGLCVNQSTLITVLPTIPPASYKATRFITDPKHSPKNRWVFYQQAMLLLGKTPDISPSGDSSGAQPAPGTSSPPFPLPPCLAWLISSSSSSSPAQAGAVPSQTLGSSRNRGRELPAQPPTPGARRSPRPPRLGALPSAPPTHHHKQIPASMLELPGSSGGE